MTHQIYQLPAQVLIASGLVQPGWKVSFFLTGTSTPADVYTTDELNVAHTQPVEADAAGVMPVIYLDPEVTYKSEVYDAANALQPDFGADPVNDDVITQQSVGQALFPITAAETAAGVTPTNYAYPELNVLRYGNNTTPGTTDMSAAFTAAFAVAAQSSGRTVIVPPGTFKVVDNLTHSVSFLWLVGAGSGSTTIQFAPTANGICYEVSDGADMMLGGGIRGIRFYSTDSTYAKTAIKIGDLSTFVIDDVYVAGNVTVSSTNFWSGGAASKGLVLAGRENITVRNYRFDCDMPVQISDNPNSTLDLDHVSFEDGYLLGNGNPLITVDTGVNITNMTFGGVQAWVGGTAGFYFVDTTSAGSKYRWKFSNVRGEQGTSTSAYLFDIESNTTVNGIVFDNCFLANDRNGIKLRNAQAVSYPATQWSMASRVALDVDNTVLTMGFRDCSCVASSVSLSGQRLIGRTQFTSSGDLLPATGDYVSTVYNSMRGVVVGDAVSEPGQTVANNAIVQLNGAACGLLTIIDDRGNVGEFSLNGALNDTTEIHDPKTAYSVTAATGSMTNIYYSGGTYNIQNSTGAERKYKWFLAGSYVAL